MLRTAFSLTFRLATETIDTDFADDKKCRGA